MPLCDFLPIAFSVHNARPMSLTEFLGGFVLSTEGHSEMKKCDGMEALELQWLPTIIVVTKIALGKCLIAFLSEYKIRTATRADFCKVMMSPLLRFFLNKIH